MLSTGTVLTAVFFVSGVKACLLIPSGLSGNQAQHMALHMSLNLTFLLKSNEFSDYFSTVCVTVCIILPILHPDGPFTTGLCLNTFLMYNMLVMIFM